MTTEAIPVVDLRLLSQSELASLARSDPSAFDLHRCDDVVVPRIDRSVFNESAGSRKQTYSRLRLASRSAADPSHTPQPPSLRDPDHDLILSSLRALFAREASSQPLALASLPPSLPPPPPSLERDREVLNANGVAVDLVALGEKVDPFGEVMRRRTEGLSTVEGLLGFLTGLDGQWASHRMKKKVVDAAGFGDHLPRGWRLSIGIKKREVVPRLFCRRYISPCGKRFKSCKEVSSYILSLIGSQVASQPISQQTSESHFRHDRLTYENNAVGCAYQYDATKEISTYPATGDIFHGSTDDQKQIVLYTPGDQGNPKPNRILECDKCNLSFSGDEDYLQHLVTFHQRSAKRRKLIKTVGDGVIIKDGMFECQFCHKTFTERRRYNGHVGSHVRYQGVSSGAFPDDTVTDTIINPSSLTTVPCVWSDVDFSVIRIGNHPELESSAPKYVNEQHTTSNCELDTGNQQNCCATQSTQEPCASKSVGDHVHDHNEPQSESNKTLDTCHSVVSSTVVSSVPVDVNNVKENHSPKYTTEECMSGLIDVQIDGCDMITVRSESIVKATVDKTTEPSICLNVVSPLPDVCDSPGEKINRIDNVLDDDIDITGYQSELLAETNKSAVIKTDSDALDDKLPQSLTDIETSSCKTRNDKDLSSSDVISETEKNDTDQKIDSEGNWIDLSGKRSIDDVGTNGFTQRIGKPVSVEMETSNFISDFGNIHVLADNGADMDDTMHDDLHVSNEDHGFTLNGKPVSIEMDASNLRSDFGNIHLLDDKGADMGNTMHDNLHASSEQGINLNSSVPSPFCDVNDEVVGPGLGFSFNDDKRESVIKETDKQGPDLEICFQRNTEYGGDAICGDDDNDNLRIALQLNVANMSSSWLSPSSELPILELIPNQCEGSSAGQKHENILGFEGLSEGRIEPSDFVLLNGQDALPESAMELDYISGLEDKRGPPIQLRWDEPLPSDVQDCNFSTVCVWCNREFNCEGNVAELQSNTLGFMCPVCKEKLPV